MSSFNQDPYRPVGDPTVTSTGETGERARAAADSLVGPAGDVKDTAVAAGQDVLETAKHEAGQVVGEAKTQGRRLLDESVGARASAGACPRPSPVTTSPRRCAGSPAGTSWSRGAWTPPTTRGRPPSAPA